MHFSKDYTPAVLVRCRLAAALLLSGTLFATAGAQSGGQSFEVASIKPSPPFVLSPGTRSPQSFVIRPNGLSAAHQSLGLYITVAYGGTGLHDIVGPEWIDRERFDIIARSPAPSGRQEILRMLRTLLAERFGLRTHRESREMDGYALVLASGSRRAPGLYPVNVDCDATAAPQPGNQVGLFVPEKRPACGASTMSMPLASGPILRTRRHSAITMDSFARGLAGGVGRPVVNRTGLEGTFDVEFRYVEEVPGMDGLKPLKERPVGVSFRDALRQQLGFELKPERVNV